MAQPESKVSTIKEVRQVGIFREMQRSKSEAKGQNLQATIAP
jgi:hypothetical protein